MDLWTRIYFSPDNEEGKLVGRRRKADDSPSDTDHEGGTLADKLRQKQQADDDESQTLAEKLRRKNDEDQTEESETGAVLAGRRKKPEESQTLADKLRQQKQSTDEHEAGESLADKLRRSKHD